MLCCRGPVSELSSMRDCGPRDYMSFRRTTANHNTTAANPPHTMTALIQNRMAEARSFPRGSFMCAPMTATGGQSWAARPHTLEGVTGGRIAASAIVSPHFV